MNESLHLTAVDLSEGGEDANPWVRAVRRDYLAPYHLVDSVDTALVLGAGAGNDVSVLLQRGAQHIDAVEIDAQIVELGRELHFQEPYSDPHVQVHVNDARAYLKTTSRKYDVVVFGTLDSQTLLSGKSSVRLDNYVYTLEALQGARDVLTPGGAIIMYHMSPRRYVAAKIFQMMAATFQAPPHVLYFDPHRLFNVVFVSRDSPTDGWYGADQARRFLEDVKLPTDDWPFLYLARPTLPTHYLKALAVVVIFSLLLVVGAGGRELRGGADIQMFLLGLGFLLLETKSVTEMSLLFGSTWEVNLLVFSSILLVILVANWLVIWRRGVPVRPVIGVLLLSLAAGYLVPVRALAGDRVWLEWLLGGALVALPVFFAALAFASLFRTRGNPVRSLGYNLFGAAVGGVLEYSVMLIGVKKLYLVAALAYALLLLSVVRRATTESTPGSQPIET